MPAALEGLRILDLTTGPAGGLATMIFADFGADVVTLRKPGRSTYADLLPASPMWRRGKTALELDLADAHSRADFETLLAGADALVCNWRPSKLAAFGLDWQTLHARHPHLVFTHISGFGSSGPKTNYPGYEHVVAAASGRMRTFAGIPNREGPVFSALQVGVHACAQTAAAATLAALLARGDNKHGQLVETSMLQGMLPYEQGAMIAAQFPDRFALLAAMMQPTSSEPNMPSLYYHPAQAKDGRWMQFGNLLPHLFDNFLIVTDLVDLLADPDFNHAQMVLPPEKHEAFRDRMLARIQERTAAEWMTDLIADGGVVGTRYQTTQEALQDPDIVANGHAIETPDGGVQLGPLARLTATPAVPARTPGIDLDAWRTSPRPAPTTPDTGELPLKGIRVVELATIIAAPLSASFLADMGAEVIKVEQLGGDPYRGLGVGVGSSRVNAGKRSISVDLKSDAGKAAVLRLLANADVLIHNFRPGVPERLGIGYEALSALNPGLVYLQSNGYGPDGPGALRPSTHPIPGAAMGGVMYQMAGLLPSTLQDNEGLRYWTRRMMRANEVNPDPNTALVITTSVMLGLAARQATGKGQQIFVDMFGANAWANHDDFLSYPGKADRAMPDEMLYGLHATYRLYPCASEQWVFLALVSDDERQQFCSLLSAAGITAPSTTVLADGGDAAALSLSALFLQRDADFWEATLAPAGIGCVRADGPPPSGFWLQDPQAQALGLTTPVRHPEWGDYRRHGPLAFFGEHQQSRTAGAPPLAGQHNREILLEAGIDDDAVSQLEADGVIWAEQPAGPE